MKVEKQDSIKIKLKGDNVGNFKSAIKKVLDDQERIGFNKTSLTEDEHQTLKDLSEKL